MTATLITPQSRNLDLKGERLTPFFGSFPGITDPFWYASMVEDGLGSEPGKATIMIQNNLGVLDESAYAVALNPDGPMAYIKHDTQVRVWRDYYYGGNTDANLRAALAFSGKVSIIRHIRNSKTDAIMVTASDARMELRKVRIMGKFISDGAGVYYQQGWPAHFNPGGRANCIHDGFGRPWFSPHPDYGISPTSNENPADPNDMSVSVVCYWTLGKIMQYLRNTVGPDSPLPASLADQIAYFPGFAKCPDWIIWPSSFGSVLDIEAIANFNQGVGQNATYIGANRKGRDINLSGMYLAGAPGREGVFDLLFNTAGGWSWNLQYDNFDAAGNVTNTLIAQQNRYTGSPINLLFGAGGPASDTLAGPTINEIDLEESSEETVSRVVASGGLVKVETRLYSSVTNSPFDGGNGPLIPAWTAARYDAWRTAVVTLGGDETAFHEACAAYPEVLTVWQLNPSYNFMFGTDFENYPQAPITRPLWPYLLSFQGGEDGPTDNNIKPYPVQCEVDLDGAATWVTSVEASGLEIWDNGIVYLPALRSITTDITKRGWRWNTGSDSSFGTSGGMIDISVNDVRMTVAIPCDHRFSYAVRTLSDTNEVGSSSVDYYETMENSPDADRFESTFSRTKFLELRTLYELWLRYDSFPEPAAAGGVMFDDKASLSDALRNDQDLMASHARRDLRQSFRLGRDGALVVDGYFITEIPVGLPISFLLPYPSGTGQPYPARHVIGRRRFLCDRVPGENGVDTFKNRTEFKPL